MTRWLWRLAPAVLFSLSLAIALAAFAPASLVAALVEHASGNRLTLAGASGSLWDGRGALSSRSGDARVFVAWTLEPRALLEAQLGGTLTVGAAQPAAFVATRNAIELGRIDIALPAAIVAEALGAYGGYRIGGMAQLKSERAYLHRDNAQARFNLEWTNAASGLVDVSPLGSYVAEIEWRSSTGSISVRSREGPLLLDGAGRWSQDGAALALDARASGERAETIKAWLRTMTPEQPGGRFRFAWPVAQSKRLSR